MRPESEDKMKEYRELVKLIGGPAYLASMPYPVRCGLKAARTYEQKARILAAYVREIPALHCRMRTA